MAPEWIALAGLLAAFGIGGHSTSFVMALPLLVIAAGHHPLGLGAVLGWLLLAIRMGLEKRHLVFGLLLALLFGLFRMIWMWRIAQCDAGGLSCFQTIALGSSEEIGMLEIVSRAFYDRLINELGWLSSLSLLGIVVARKGKYLWWTIGLLLGIVVLGLSISTLRPYHLRLAAAPIAVISAIGLSILGRRGLALGGVALIGSTISIVKLDKAPGQLAAHDEMAAALESEGGGPIWVDGLQGGAEYTLYPGAVVLSAWLNDSDRQFSTSPHDSKLVFFEVDGVGEPFTINWSMKTFDSIQEARPWIDRQRSAGKDIGGAHDWAVRLHPPEKVDSHLE